MTKLRIVSLVLAIALVAVACVPPDETTEAGTDTGTESGSGSSTTAPSESPSPTPATTDTDTTDPDTTDPDRAPSPAGEPAGVLYNSNATGNFEVYRVDADGTSVQLTNDAEFDSFWARPSPDRSQFLFHRTPAGTNDQDFTTASLWMAAADGSNLRQITSVGEHGWVLQGHAEWSPDGTRLALFAGGRSNPQIWTTDINGDDARQITNEGGTNVDPSWSPDGSTIAYAGCPRSVCFPGDLEIYTVPANGGTRVRMTNDDLRDHDPYYSPDGSSLAFLTQISGATAGQAAGLWDIRLIPAAGGDVRTLTASDRIVSLPRWSPDGSSIYSHQLVYGAGSGFDLIRIDPDSGEITPVVATGASEEYPSP